MDCNSGLYSYRWIWGQCQRTTDNVTGDRPKLYVNNGYLFGTYELDSSIEQDEYGATRSTASGTIRIRQFPPISPLDRLYCVAFNETYVVDGVRRDQPNNQMIVDIHRLDMGGAPEFVGNQGNQGNQGTAGLQGLQGLQGNQGNQGTAGLQGPQGYQGNQGYYGTQGFQGVAGLQGAIGSQGNQGYQGATGTAGLQGNQGTTGLQGLQGLQGAQGRQGYQGYQGIAGAQGAQGAQGTTGFQGFQGAGLQGYQGFQGTAGSGGSSSISLQADANITIGNVVYVSASGHCNLAQANSATTTLAIGFAGASITSGSSGNITVQGTVTLTTAQWDAVAGTSGGLVFNTPYYVSATTAGNITATAPTTAGQYVTPVGIAISATTLLIILEPVIKL